MDGPLSGLERLPFGAEGEPSATPPPPDVAGPSFTVRPARFDDIPGIVALQRAVIAEGAWFIAEPDELGNPEEDLRARLAMARAGKGIVLVAESTAGRMVLRGPPRPPQGWIVVDAGDYRRTRHVGRLEVMVASPARGNGAGRALVEAAIAACGGIGVTRLTLAVYAHNARARALYASLGFVEEGRRVGEYRMPDGSYADDILMARQVGQGSSR